MYYQYTFFYPKTATKIDMKGQQSTKKYMNFPLGNFILYGRLYLGCFSFEFQFADVGLVSDQHIIYVATHITELNISFFTNMIDEWVRICEVVLDFIV